jgi:hypothetical protein
VPNRIVPRTLGTSPEMLRSSVLLPALFASSVVIVSPPVTVNDASWSTSTAPWPAQRLSMTNTNVSHWRALASEIGFDPWVFRHLRG